ncbi:hypothetical protein D3C73_1615200 [compost metagenome]
MFDGVEDLAMQIESGLAARDSGHVVLQRGSHDTREIAVQLAQRRVVCSVDQALVERQVATDISIHITMKMFGAAF